MNLIKIVITSDTTNSPAQIVGRGTWAEFKAHARVQHRFFITRHFDDGTARTVYTNKNGEGLFATDNQGAEYQITGTSQYSVSDKTATDAKRWFKGKLRRELAQTGAELVFELDY